MFLAFIFMYTIILKNLGISLLYSDIYCAHLEQQLIMIKDNNYTVFIDDVAVVVKLKLKM